MNERNSREIKELRRKFPSGVRVVGITGGIASGKTAATDALREHGANVIDADEVSRKLAACGTPLDGAIKTAFPDCVKDGKLDRRALRAEISSSDKARQKLNKLTHPAIAAETERLISASTKPVVLSAPLLFECALARLCDCVICITCPREIKISRIAARDGVDDRAAEKMIDAQISDSMRVALSDLVVPSNTALDVFRKEITELYDELTG